MIKHELYKHFQDAKQYQSEHKFYGIFLYESKDELLWKMEIVPKDEAGFNEVMNGWTFFDYTGNDHTGTMPRFIRV